MRSFFDPLAGFGNFLEDLGGFITGETAGEQQAEALKLQAKQAEIEGARELRDEREQQKLRTSRMLALAGARGRGTELLGAISADAAEGGIREQRIQANTEAARKGLRFQARSVKAASTPTIFNALGVAGNLFSVGQGITGSSLLGGGNTLKPTSTTPAYRRTRTGRLGGPV